MPKISVIIIAFNHETYLPESIKSVLNQSFTDFELIIWDDASADNSWQIINRFKDPRIRFFQNREQRQGVWCLNKSIREICSGEFIANQHACNTWERDKLEKQADFLDAHKEYGAVFTWAQVIDQFGNPSENNWFIQENKHRFQWLRQLFNECNHFCYPSALIRKECYREVGVYRYGLSLTSDAEMLSRILIKYPVHVIQESLAKQRDLTGQSTSVGDSSKTRIRAKYEWDVLRRNYIAISDLKDLTAIFPSLDRYKNRKGSDNIFLLAMACLNDSKVKNARNFGLMLLYDLMSEENRRQKISEIYSFTDLDLIRLTREYDLYKEHLFGELCEQNSGLIKTSEDRDGKNVSFKKTATSNNKRIESYKQDIADRDKKITCLNQKVLNYETDINALRNSTSWRITKPLRLLSNIYEGWKCGQICLFSKTRIARIISMVKRGHGDLSEMFDDLPDSFNEEIYLKLNPDLKVAGVDPTMHYLLHGRNEGREFALPEMDTNSAQHFNDDLETILIVCHEASRTGAPILGLNLVQAFVRKNNVVVLLLSGGDIADEFRLTGAAVMTAEDLRGNTDLSYLVVSDLCERFNFKFALVNSAESREVLQALCDQFVPTISLVHEFASYSRPRNAIRNVFFWSSETVFSTRLTLENALSEHPDMNRLYAHILPQGRCLVPLEGQDTVRFLTERERIRRSVRPDDIDDNSVIVLGAGFVQLRKGVDLFIECAARIVHTLDGKKWRFVWIGSGYDPDNEIGYSVYLADQIRRAGLKDHVFIFDETPAIETAFEEADLFLLSSRLDPLPNVAIDAMANGVPVICFDKSTGIADFLIETGLRKYCVAEYLNSADMAVKVMALADSPDLYRYVSGRCREASQKYFNMEEYVNRLEILAQNVCNRSEREKLDSRVILDSSLFRMDFSCPLYRKVDSIEKAVRSYVRSWACGFNLRKPFPGFHPGIYMEQHGVTEEGADPFADYLREECPVGPWNYPIIVACEKKEQDLPENKKVALHLHTYYPELLCEITKRFLYNRICPDLFISIASEKDREFVLSELEDYKGSIIDIKVVPNRGRDIGPFLTAFGDMFSGGYDFVGHIHTKKSADVKDSSMGKNWYIFMIENLLGGKSGAMADSILSKMRQDPSIGMVFPDDPHIVGFGDNRTIAESLAERVGIKDLPEQCVFPVGTMFWARTSALSPMTALKLSWDDYPEEPLPYDGTLLHAIERLFPLSLTAVGNLGFAATNVFGVTR